MSFQRSKYKFKGLGGGWEKKKMNWGKWGETRKELGRGSKLRVSYMCSLSEAKWRKDNK